MDNLYAGLLTAKLPGVVSSEWFKQVASQKN
jgi:hypothetical protein